MSAHPISAPDQPDDRALLAAALEAARLAGGVLRRMFRERPEARDKTSARDLVTAADLAAERVVLDYVEAHFPDHGWRSEESGLNERPSPYLWVVDPLDGTSNFAHGFPHFCVSVSVLYEGRSVAGVVLDPMRGETFTARQGGGAKLNGRRIRASGVTTLERAMVTTGFPYEPPAYRSAYADLTARVIERVQGMRRSGSAALDLAYVATGRLEAHFEFGLSLHDIAAGVLLVDEAGGRVTELSLPEWKAGYLATGTPEIEGAIVDLHRRFLGPVEARPSPLVAR